jgi:hypothetical protein
MLAGRRVWAGLLATFLLLGAIDLHAPGEVLDSLANLQGEHYSSSARHPDRPAHFEESCDASRPACPACLHQLRTSGAHLLPAAGLEPLSVQTSRFQEPQLSSGHDARGPSGARAPPAV